MAPILSPDWITGQIKFPQFLLMHLTYLCSAFIAFDHNFLGGSWSLNQQVNKRQPEPSPVNKITYKEVSAVLTHLTHLQELFKNVCSWIQETHKDSGCSFS